jgi:hypothetical protein
VPEGQAGHTPKEVLAVRQRHHDSLSRNVAQSAAFDTS